MAKAVCSVMVFLTVFIGVSTQAQTPQPGPDAKKLAMFVGSWQYEGTAKASPLGPAAKIAGKQTGRLVGGGFAVALTGEESGVFGGIQWGETDVYDSASKSNRYLGYQNDGSIWQGSSSFSGNVLKFSGTQTAKGVSYWVRGAITFAPDGKSYTQQTEISTDGKTWAPWWELKCTKAS
jgi:hypothetical protein